MYWQVPFYKGEHIKFDVMPSQLPLTVEHDSVVIAVINLDCCIVNISFCNVMLAILRVVFLIFRTFSIA